MSLILDAIKKSERERRQQEIPDLSSDHNAYNSTAVKTKWSNFIILSLLILLSFFGYQWLVDRDNNSPVKALVIPDNIGSVARKKNKLLEPEVSQKKYKAIAKNKPLVTRAEIKQQLKINHLQQNKKNNHPLIPAKDRIGNNKIKSQAVFKPNRQLKHVGNRSKKSGVISNVGAVITIEKLPIALLKKIPDLKYSSHIYTGDSATSFVVINTKILGVGESLNDIVSIAEIDEDGVVLLISNKKVWLEKLQSWKK